MVAEFRLEPEVEIELLGGLKLPKDAPAWQRGIHFYALGEIAIRQGGKNEEAIANLKKSDELYPDGMACGNLCVLFEQMGMLKEAEEYAQRAVAYEPDRIAYWDKLLDILFAQGKYEEAGKLRSRVSLLKGLY